MGVIICERRSSASAGEEELVEFSTAKATLIPWSGTRAPSAADEFCRQKGIRIADSYDAVLADASVEAVVLATPHSQHGEQARRAAAAGKQVFTEKPFTLMADDAESAIAAARKAGVVLAVASTGASTRHRRAQGARARRASATSARRSGCRPRCRRSRCRRTAGGRNLTRRPPAP